MSEESQRSETAVTTGTLYMVILTGKGSGITSMIRDTWWMLCVQETMWKGNIVIAVKGGKKSFFFPRSEWEENCFLFF